MRQIPIRVPLTPGELETKVKSILAARAQNPAADVTVLEAEIDRLVYRLYGLTAEEIKIVEGK
jgi:hypothetical protein